MVVAYPAFRYWAYHVHSESAVVNAAWLGAYFLYLTGLLFLPILLFFNYHIGIATASCITCEQVTLLSPALSRSQTQTIASFLFQTRLAMKVHGFLRENAPRALAWKRAAQHRLKASLPPLLSLPLPLLSLPVQATPKTACQPRPVRRWKTSFTSPSHPHLSTGTVTRGESGGVAVGS